MTRKPASAKRLLFYFTSLIASQAVAALSGHAATLTSVEGLVTLDNFSHAPQDIGTLVDVNARAIAVDGTVTVDIIVDSIFLNDSSPQAANFTRTDAAGSGNDYLGFAQVQSQVSGQAFSIQSGETYSFDYTSFLKVDVFNDFPERETASTAGQLSLWLYDITSQDNRQLIDSLTLLAGANLSDQGSFQQFQLDTGPGFEPEFSASQTFGNDNQTIITSLNTGSFARTFDEATSLALVAEVSSDTLVTAGSVSPEPIPEPSTYLGSLVLLGLGLRLYRKSLK